MEAWEQENEGRRPGNKRMKDGRPGNKRMKDGRPGNKRMKDGRPGNKRMKDGRPGNKRMKDVLVNVEFVSSGCSVKELEILSVSCIRVDVLLCR